MKISLKSKIKILRDSMKLSPSEIESLQQWKKESIQKLSNLNKNTANPSDKNPKK